MIEQFFSGFGFILRGRKLYATIPKIKRWVVVPFLLDIILLIAGFYFGADLIGATVTKATQFFFSGDEGLLYALLYYPLLIMFWVVFVVIYFYFVYAIASVISSPFYAIVAEKTLVYFGYANVESRSIGQTIKVAFNMFWVSLVRSFIMIIIALFLFVVSFIPGLNLLAGFCIFIIIAMDTIDYSLEVKAVGIGGRFSLLRDNFPEICGMAAFLGLTVLIPGLILLVTPFAVIGAAEQFTKMSKIKR